MLQKPTNSNDSMSKTLDNKVRQLWKSVLHLDKLPNDDSSTFFTLGGSSLTLVQLFNHYQFELSRGQNLNILDFLAQPTIGEHIRLLSMNTNTTLTRVTLYNALQGNIQVELKTNFVSIISIFALGPATIIQENIWLKKQNNFVSASLPINNIQLAFIISPDSLVSLQCLKQALILLINKHMILRTCLTMTSDGTSLKQRVMPYDDKSNSLVQVSRINTVDELEDIILNEKMNRNHFDLTTGRVFRCHAIYRSKQGQEDLLVNGDVLLFSFHHMIFDNSSEEIFLNDLKRAYATGMLDTNKKEIPTYIDYALEDRNTCNDKILLGRTFWKTTLNDYENHIQLPYDCRPSIFTATRPSSSIKLKLMTYANQVQTNLFQIYLSAYYIFLYKLTQCKDIVVDTCITARPRHEFMYTMGLFDRFLPFRCCLEPQEKLASLIERIKQMNILAMVYASQFDPNIMNEKSNLFFRIPVAFQFKTITSQMKLTDECKLVRYDWSPDVTEHDLYLSIEINECKQVTGSFVYARDVFDETTITVMARRFETLLNQIFLSPSTTAICEYSLLLPHEKYLLEDLNNVEHSNLSSNFLLIHQKFACQAKEHSQKLAVVLDDQSLTYAELLHLSQLLACYLKEKCCIKSGDIVGQCMERSIEMVCSIHVLILIIFCF